MSEVPVETKGLSWLNYNQGSPQSQGDPGLDYACYSVIIAAALPFNIVIFIIEVTMIRRTNRKMVIQSKPSNTSSQKNLPEFQPLASDSLKLEVFL